MVAKGLQHLDIDFKKEKVKSKSITAKIEQNKILRTLDSDVCAVQDATGVQASKQFQSEGIVGN